MAYRTILVSLNDIKRVEAVLTAAASLQDSQGAHVVGLYAIPAVQVYPTIGMEITPDVFEGHRTYFRERAEKVKERFDALVGREGLSAEFRMIESQSPLVADSVIEHGRCADLIIIPQVDREAEEGVEMDFDDRVVTEAGRPVMVLPAEGRPKKFNRVVIGWNSTRMATRALFDALPLLCEASQVEVAWVNPQLEPELAGALPGAEIAQVLARHGVKAETVPLPTVAGNNGEALLQRAIDTGADVLVMGAYEHSRFREFVFGGATRHVLRNAPIPVLMSH